MTGKSAQLGDLNQHGWLLAVNKGNKEILPTKIDIWLFLFLQ